MSEKAEKMNILARDVLILSRNTLLVNLRFLDAALSQFEFFPIEESTLLTDGKHILYNPRHILENYKAAKEIPVRDYLHMVMHCVFRHMYFNFSNRAKGSHVSAYLRSSKLVYLPDNFGKPVVASIDKDAFPEDTAVMCSKRLFAKLAPDNKLATIRAFLTDSTPFISEEQKHLREYIKKNRAEILEAFISAEDTELLRKCLTVLKNTDEVFCLLYTSPSPRDRG